jgi:hypothetical protein
LKNSTDKVILRSHGLTLVSFKPWHCLEMGLNMSEASIRELDVVHGLAPAGALNSVLGHPFVFAVKRGKEAVAVLGLTDQGDGTVKLWTLFSKSIEENFLRLVRASPALMKFIHTTAEEIEIDVWSHSSMIQNWLVLIGFMPIDSFDGGNGQTIIRFVRCNQKDFLAYPENTQRPVMH